MANKSQSSQELGSNIIVGGLIVQILFFSCFVLIGVIFNSRIARKPTAQSVSAEIPWQKHLRTLYSVSALILVRSIFRVVEFLQGNAGFIMSHEVFLYIFDAVLMFAVTAILNFVHPSVIYALLKGGKTTQGYLLRTAAQGTSLS